MEAEAGPPSLEAIDGAARSFMIGQDHVLATGCSLEVEGKGLFGTMTVSWGPGSGASGFGEGASYFFWRPDQDEAWRGREPWRLFRLHPTPAGILCSR